MHLDDIALRIVEEDLIPTLHGPGAVVGIGEVFFVEPPLEGLDVIGAKGDVPALHGVDDLPGAKADAEVLFRQMKLRRAVGAEGNLARVAVLVQDAPRLQRRFRFEIEYVAIERIERRHVSRAEVDVVQLDLHGGASLRVRIWSSPRYATSSRIPSAQGPGARLP